MRTTCTHQQFKLGHANNRFTCAIESGHVHHGFMIGELDIFLGYHQLDFVPLLRLRKKQMHP